MSEKKKIKQKFKMSLKHIWQFLLIIIKRIDRDTVTVYAAQATFFILIAAIPFIMLLITLIQFFIPIAKADFMEMAVSIFPKSISKFVQSVVEELFSKSPGSIISVTALTALWSASRGFVALRHGLNRVYQPAMEHGYIKNRSISIFYTLIFIIALVFSLSVLIFGNSILSIWGGKSTIIKGLLYGVLQMKDLISLVIFTLFFALIYKFLPTHKVSFKRQLPGAFFAALGWILFSFGYSVYIENFSNYSYVYGSLAAVVLLMLWVYFCLMILLIGAEINKLLQDTAKAKKLKK